MSDNTNISKFFNEAGIPEARDHFATGLTLTIANAWFALSSLSNPEEVATEPVYDRNELPPSIKEFLDSLEGMDPFSKMQRIHQFTVHAMEYGDNPRFISTFSEILGDYSIENPDGTVQWKVSCRDFMVFEASLLRHAGFKDDQIAMISGKFDYKLDSGKEYNNLVHGIIAVSIDGKTYVLDQNMRDPTEIGANLKYGGVLIAASEGDSVIGAGISKLTSIYWAKDFDGQDWTNPLPPSELEKLSVTINPGSKPTGGEARGSDIAAFNKAEARYNNRHITHEGRGGQSDQEASHNPLDPAENTSIKETASKISRCAGKAQGLDACLDEIVLGNIPNAKGNIRQR